MMYTFPVLCFSTVVLIVSMFLANDGGKFMRFTGENSAELTIKDICNSPTCYWIVSVTPNCSVKIPLC